MLRAIVRITNARVDGDEARMSLSGLATEYSWPAGEGEPKEVAMDLVFRDPAGPLEASKDDAARVGQVRMQEDEHDGATRTLILPARAFPRRMFNELQELARTGDGELVLEAETAPDAAVAELVKISFHSVEGCPDRGLTGGQGFWDLAEHLRAGDVLKILVSAALVWLALTLLSIGLFEAFRAGVRLLFHARWHFSRLLYVGFAVAYGAVTLSAVLDDAKRHGAANRLRDYHARRLESAPPEGSR